MRRDLQRLGQLKMRKTVSARATLDKSWAAKGFAGWRALLKEEPGLKRKWQRKIRRWLEVVDKPPQKGR